jgi:broad-specificity NMP kinase
MSFIIAITGPTGSGKSTIAKQIAGNIQRCVNIDVDVVKHFIHNGFNYDDSPEGAAQWELLGTNIGQLAVNFKQAGYNVIINGYLNVPAWSKLQSFTTFDSKFLLLPDIDTILKRDGYRSAEDAMGEEAVKTHAAYFSTNPYFDDFIKINSTEHSVEETVAAVLDQMNVPNQNSVNVQVSDTQDLYQIVDDQDNLIGAKPRNEINFKNDYYRISGLWLTNSKGQILIA